jgi:VIT1/CCC1 family predicted Fe2+/Mn2+ transporter
VNRKRPSPSPGSVEYRPHVGQSRQYVRDIILGVNDGLVSTFLLVAGVVGGGLATAQVLLTAVAGAIAGAVSMAAGEYLATQSQEEVFDREIEIEKEHIKHFRGAEIIQMRQFLEDVGIAEDDLDTTLAAFSRTDQTLLNAMKVFEFAVVDSERRSPLFAMVMSGVLFLAGALPPTLPFMFAPSAGVGLAWAATTTAAGLFAVGVAKTRVTGTSPVWAGLQNLAIAGVGGVVAYVVGSLVDGVIA